MRITWRSMASALVFATPWAVVLAYRHGWSTGALGFALVTLVGLGVRALYSTEPR